MALANAALLPFDVAQTLKLQPASLFLGFCLAGRTPRFLSRELPLCGSWSNMLVYLRPLRKTRGANANWRREGIYNWLKVMARAGIDGYLNYVETASCQAS